MIAELGLAALWLAAALAALQLLAGALALAPGGSGLAGVVRPVAAVQGALAALAFAALLIVFFTVAVTLKPPVGMKDAALGALVAAFPNTGFMGVPLIVALLGSQAGGVVISTILADLFVTSSVCSAP